MCCRYPCLVEAKVVSVTDGTNDWRGSRLGSSTVVQKVLSPPQRADGFCHATQALLLKHGIEVPDCGVFLEVRCRLRATCQLASWPPFVLISRLM